MLLSIILRVLFAPFFNSMMFVTNAPLTLKKEVPMNNLQNPPAPEKSDLEKAIDFVVKNLTTARKWTGREDRKYVTISTTGIKPLNPAWAKVGDVALAILANIKAQRDANPESNSSLWCTFFLNLDGQLSECRLISVTAEGQLVCSLETHYKVSNVKGSLTSFTAKPKAEVVTEEEIVVDPAQVFTL